MKSSSAYREAAWNSLSGNWGSAAVLTLVYFLITSVASSIDVKAGGLIIILLTAPMIYSYEIIFLDNLRSGKAFDVQSLFEGYNDYLRITGTYLLMCVYICLWTLLLVIPGIIKSVAYSQTLFILRDEPTLKYNGAIERSMAMMEGHKMDFFLLILSFIGWYILGIVSLGIGFLWINPYITRALVIFYEDLKSEYENKTIA